MFSTLGFIPVPDTATIVGIVIVLVIMAVSTWYVNKRKAEREMQDRVDAEIAKRAAKSASKS